MVAILPGKYSPPKRQQYDRNNLLERLAEREKRVVPVLNSEFPREVLGYFSPSGKRGAYGKDHQQILVEHLKHHENLAHNILGIDGSPHGEHLADSYAAERTGNTDLIRGPFYRPPINLN